MKENYHTYPSNSSLPEKIYEKWLFAAQNLAFSYRLTAKG
jgi:hypothetical protein